MYLFNILFILCIGLFDYCNELGMYWLRWNIKNVLNLKMNVLRFLIRSVKWEKNYLF